MRTSVLLICCGLLSSSLSPALAQSGSSVGAKSSFRRFFREMEQQRQRGAAEEEQQATAFRQRRMESEQTRGFGVIVRHLLRQ
jgi:hypothetical protein